MRRFALIATVAATVLAAAPAFAAPIHPISSRGEARGATDGANVCRRGGDSKACAAYQEQLLRTVGEEGAARNVSVNDLGRRQLDALVASIG